MNFKFLSVRIIIFLILGILFFSFTFNKSDSSTNNQYFAKIKNIKINLEIADSILEKSIGLMYRDNLNPDSGMLFIFKPAQKTVFWMKNVNFPLDLLFISNDKIVKIYEGVPPCISEPCTTYPSKFTVDYALEVNAGFCKKNGVKPGDNIVFSSNTKTFIEDSNAQ